MSHRRPPPPGKDVDAAAARTQPTEVLIYNVKAPGRWRGKDEQEGLIRHPWLPCAGCACPRTDETQTTEPVARETVAAVEGLRGGRLRIASMPSQVVSPLTALLAGFSRRYPEVNVAVAAAARPDDVRDTLRRGVAEIGVVATAGHTEALSDLDRLPIESQSFVLVARDDATLPPGDDALTIGELAGLRLVAGQPGTGMRRVADAITAVLGRAGEGGRCPIPAVTWRQEHIDALVAKVVLDPARFDVIVGSNLFGDILSDLAAAVAGGIGIAPAANLNPERDHPSMFEPVHGSAPDIAGQGSANPLGAIWCASMMLDHLGHPEAAAGVFDAFASVLATTGARTPDLGGTATTKEFTDLVLQALARQSATRL
ncbi:isocitrate/isopropylmalate family dehydrogenase [Spirillospora sp. CA-255316]